jgi:hypothetical protein
MIFDREGISQIEKPSEKKLKQQLSYLKGIKKSFATLSKDSNNFIQMAGGGQTCCIEKKENGQLFRAKQKNTIVPWTKKSILSTSCGDFELKPEEYFNIEQVVEIFVSYLNDSKLPDYVSWNETNLNLIN